jgi:hypothetical protein
MSNAGPGLNFRADLIVENEGNSPDWLAAPESGGWLAWSIWVAYAAVAGWQTLGAGGESNDATRVHKSC